MLLCIFAIVFKILLLLDLIIRSFNTKNGFVEVGQEPGMLQKRQT